MSIPLPPLDGNAIITMEHLRARDQEIVAAVLEAAANIAMTNREPWTARTIRALEFHHE